MENIGIGKSFLIAVLIHLTIFIIFGIWITNSPLTVEAQPMSVSFQSEIISLSAGLGNELKAPSTKTSPHLTSRVTLPVEKNAVPEKISPQNNFINGVSPLTKTVKEQFSGNAAQKELKKDSIKEPVIRENKNNNVDSKIAGDLTNKINSFNEIQKAPVQEEKKPTKENIQTKPSDKAEDQNSEKQEINNELHKISDDIDKALDENFEQAGTSGKSSFKPGGLGGFGTSPGKDPLGGVKWTLKPRKTVFFPDIQSKIPDEYKKKGLSYAITARMTFDKNGLAVLVDIIHSSGDPNIDRIFFSELKKIRVEPIDEDKLDSITKTFSIDLK